MAVRQPLEHATLRRQHEPVAGNDVPHRADESARLYAQRLLEQPARPRSARGRSGSSGPCVPPGRRWELGRTCPNDGENGTLGRLLRHQIDRALPRILARDRLDHTALDAVDENAPARRRPVRKADAARQAAPPGVHSNPRARGRSGAGASSPSTRRLMHALRMERPLAMIGPSVSSNTAHFNLTFVHARHGCANDRHAERTRPTVVTSPGNLLHSPGPGLTSASPVGADRQGRGVGGGATSPRRRHRAAARLRAAGTTACPRRGRAQRSASCRAGCRIERPEHEECA